MLMAQKLPRGIIFIKNFLQICLYSSVYDVNLFLELNENKNTEYLAPTT